MKKDKKYFEAVALITGYAIGVGMLSLPYLFHKAGIVTFFVFFILLIPVQYLIHLLYANMIISTKEYHRMPGYAGYYFGKKTKNLVFFAKVFGNFGGLLAYIITTGVFLHELLNPIFGGSEFFYANLIFFLEAIIIFLGISMIANVELFMTAFLILIISLIIFKSAPAIDISNYTALDFKYFLLPFGAVLFALDGNGALPMAVKILKKNKQKVKSAIRLSMFLAALVTVIFVFVVLGVTGDHVTQDSLVGLNNTIGGSVVSLALIFGIFSLITSFLGVSESIKETLWWDFKINKTISWAIAVFVPYLFYLTGIRNLSEIISFVGAVGGGISSIVLILIFLKIKEKKESTIISFPKYKKTISYSLIFLFSLGIFYQICYYLFIKK